MRKWGRKLLGLLLCTIMIAGLLPGTLSLARAEGKTITGLGTGAITNPASGAGGWRGGSGGGEFFLALHGSFPLAVALLQLRLGFLEAGGKGFAVGGG